MSITTPQLLFIAALLGLIGIGCLILSLRWLSIDRLDDRIHGYIVEDVVEREPARSNIAFTIQNRELTGSIVERIFLPSLRRFLGYFGRLSPAGTVEALRAQLVIAGSPYGLGAREFFSIRMIFVVIGFIMFLFFFQRGLTQINIAAGLMSLIAFFYGPMLWLSSKVKERQKKIQRGLPDALDLLTVCASAGLGFDQSMQRVSEHMNTPIAVEFGRVISEMEMGLSRREALRNMADRLQVNDLSSFVSFILQSDQLGMSISDTLHAQAEQMRIERRFRAQEQAQKIPTKMLIPMVFLIFPSLLAIILGPAIPRLLDLAGTF